MQITIYYAEEDQWLMEEIERRAIAGRQSRSALILSILEKDVVGGKSIPQILNDFGVLNKDEADQLEGLEEAELKKKLVDQGEVNKDLFYRASYLSELESPYRQ